MPHVQSETWLVHWVEVSGEGLRQRWGFLSGDELERLEEMERRRRVKIVEAERLC